MQQKPRNAFTLIEMMVVITIIVILVALLFPAISVVEERANKTKCLNNCKQIAVAAQTMMGELVEKLPYRDDPMAWGQGADSLLPYVKYVEEVFDCPANPGINTASWASPEEKMQCLMASGRYTDYELNGFLCSSSNNMWRRQSMITDYSLAAFAYDYPYNPNKSSSYDPDKDRAHRGGVNCAYLDGHATWLADKDMGLVGWAFPDADKFFHKGHDFWHM